MASGHVSRIKRPNTWLHRPMLQNVKKALANSEPSTHGAKPPFICKQHLIGNGMKAYLSLARPGGHPRRDHREAKKNEVEYASTVAARFARDRVDWRRWLALA